MEAERDRYAIPHNYKDRGGVFEIFKPRNLIEGAGAAAGTALLLLICILPLGLNPMLSTFLIGCPALAVLVVGAFGYHDEPWSVALKNLMTARQHARKLEYGFQKGEQHDSDKSNSQKAG